MLHAFSANKHIKACTEEVQWILTNALTVDSSSFGSDNTGDNSIYSEHFPSMAFSSNVLISVLMLSLRPPETVVGRKPPVFTAVHIKGLLRTCRVLREPGDCLPSMHCYFLYTAPFREINILVSVYGNPRPWHNSTIYDWRIIYLYQACPKWGLGANCGPCLNFNRAPASVS